jgi:hypothetical protein
LTPVFLVGTTLATDCIIGANEAPPQTDEVYFGSQLTAKGSGRA